MPSFRFQSNIHLNGFQVLDACLENVTSFEGLDDKLPGRIVFLTSGDTNPSYLHPAVYNGTNFKGIALLDDIEAITNGEGSLGTRVKALEDMLGLEDVTDVIDTWNDVKEFFANVDEGLTLMTMLDGKLDKKGGTIESDSWLPLSIISGDASSVAIKLSPSSGNGMQLGWSSAQGAFLFNYQNNCQIGVHPDGYAYFKTATNLYTIIHTGNALDQLKGTFLPLTGGRIDGTAVNPLNINTTKESEVGIYLSQNNTSRVWIGYTASGGTGIYDVTTKSTLGITIEGNPHFNNSTILHSGNVGEYALKTDGSNAMTARLKFATPQAIEWTNEDSFYLFGPYSKVDYNPGWYDGTTWHQIAFTDSTVEAAKKLETAVSLWGNTFDGTQSLDGTIYLANTSRISIKDKTNVQRQILALDGNDDLVVGYDQITKSCDTRISGQSLCFIAGPSRTTAMTITEEGNVSVGAAYILDSLFSVRGLTSIYVSGSSMSLGDLPYNGLVLGGTNYTLAQFLLNSGNFAIQSYRKDTASALALNLNPLGGAVNVGEGGLNVAGTAEIKGNVLSIGGTKGANLLLKHTAGNHIWADAEGGYILLGVKDAGNASTSNASLSIYSDRVTPGARNNAVSLGISGWRWSNVYSVNGDFSGRVLIGGAADDANNKLQVLGSIKAYSPEGHAVRLDNGNVSLSLIGSTNTTVAKGLYFNFDNTYVGGLVAYHRSGSFRYLYLGDDSTPKWFTINSTESNFNVLTKFNAGALIPTGQTLTIGSVTFRETAAGEVEVDGNLHTTGTLASGGKGEVGENTTGNAQVYQYELDSGQSSYDVQNVKNNTNVIVQVYEWNNNTDSWDMILTDVSVKASGITVTFGRATTVNHLVTVC